jgi:hypothetical protein
MKKIYKAVITTVSLSVVVTMLMLGPQLMASEASGFQPIKERLLQTGQRIQPLDHLGRPDYTKDYWEVDQRGNLIQKVAGTNRTNPKGQNYRIEGGIVKPIDKLGRVEHNKKPIKLNDR